MDGNFTYPLTANQVDRATGTSNQTNSINLTWVYSLPFGRGQAFFATNRIAGMIGGGWEFSGIYKYRDGYPLQISTGGQQCEAGPYGGQGDVYKRQVSGIALSKTIAAMQVLCMAAIESGTG